MLSKMKSFSFTMQTFDLFDKVGEPEHIQNIIQKLQNLIDQGYNYVQLDSEPVSYNEDTGEAECEDYLTFTKDKGVYY